MTQIIDTFLANWKKSVKQHYVTTVNEYTDLCNNCNSLVKKYSLYSYTPKQIMPPEYIQAKKDLKTFCDIRSKSENSLIARCSYANHAGNPTETLDSFLEKFLDKEVEIKKANLIKKIEAKAGTIIDADKLYFGADGSINGYVTGNIKQVEVETIYAGGYNVQCLHYRVLVK